jgi:hypothetical protein
MPILPTHWVFFVRNPRIYLAALRGWLACFPSPGQLFDDIVDAAQGLEDGGAACEGGAGEELDVPDDEWEDLDDELCFDPEPAGYAWDVFGGKR